MSGIVGLYHLDQQSANPSDLRQMTDVLAHRGPDGSDIWCDGSIGLGHCMLWSTPESLQEKLPLASKGLAITADARIDNRDELISLVK
jgi:asparagine synthase (glutamine-hydrolysing)